MATTVTAVVSFPSFIPLPKLSEVKEIKHREVIIVQQERVEMKHKQKMCENDMQIKGAEIRIQSRKEVIKQLMEQLEYLNGQNWIDEQVIDHCYEDNSHQEEEMKKFTKLCGMMMNR